MADIINHTDFAQQFPSSDITIIAMDNDGNQRKLYATKLHLAMYSRYFEAMFYNEFKEKNVSEITVDFSFEVMETILELLYRHGHDVEVIKLHRKEHILMDLYKACDYFHMPFAVRMCKWKMRDVGQLDMAMKLLDFMSDKDNETLIPGLHEELVTCLTKLSPEELDEFLETKNSAPIFYKRDITTFFLKMTGRNLPRSARWGSWDSPMPVDICEEYNKPMVDITQPREGSDVILLAKNSDNKKFYCSREVLSLTSPFFAHQFATNDKSEILEINLDYDYWLVKNILSIPYYAYDPEFFVNQRDLFLIYSMFSIAAEDKLNFPKVRELCVLNFKQCLNDPLNSFHIDVGLLMNVGKDILFQNAPLMEILIWMRSTAPKTKDIYTVQGDQFAVSCSNRWEPLLSTIDLSAVLTRLRNELE